MNTLQTQISELRDKIDRLYSLIERISERVEELSADKQQQQIDQDSYSLPSFSQTHPHYKVGQEEKGYKITHKDILVDDNSSTSGANSGSEQNLSPDIQIRRLTAQLTAAYNRIAALEEQLLTYRIHP